MLTRFVSLTFAVVFILISSMVGQPSLKITKIDASLFPTVKVSLVTKDGNNLRRDLTASAYSLLEDGIPQAITSFTCPQSSEPFSLGIVICNGGTMSQTQFDQAKAAANSILSIMSNPNDEATFITYSGGHSVVIFMTNDKVSIQDGVNGASLDIGQSNLWDGTAPSIVEVKTNGSNARKAVVVLSDGIDNGSLNDLNSVVSLALANNIKVYTVGIGVGPGSPGASNLQSIAGNTGGVYWAGASSGFEQTLAAYVRGTPEDCILQYTTNSNCRDGQFRNVRASVVMSSGSASADSTYKLSQDPGTIVPAIFAVDTLTLVEGNAGVLPVKLVTPLASKRFYPVRMVLTFDTSKVKLDSVGVAGTLADSLNVALTRLATGAQLDLSPAKMINGSGTLLRLHIRAGTTAQPINVPVAIASMNFSKGCLQPQLVAGHVVVRPRVAALTHTISAPTSVQWSPELKNYATNPITIVATLRNAGDLDLSAVQGTLQLQGGMTFVTGYSAAQPASPPTITAGQTATIEWKLLIGMLQVQQSFALPITFTASPAITRRDTIRFTVDQAGAVLAISCSAPNIVVQNNDYSPNPFNIGLTAQNSGGSAAVPQATLVLPAGLTLENDQATKTMASIAVGSQGQMQWNVRAVKSAVVKVYDVLVILEGSGVKKDTCIVRVTTPALGNAPSLSTNCFQLPAIVFDGVTKLYKPNPFPLTLTVSNTGLAASDTVKVILRLPPELTATPLQKQLGVLNPADSGTATWLVTIGAAGCTDRTVRISADIFSGGVLVKTCDRDVVLPAKMNTKPRVNSSLPASLDTAILGRQYTFSVQASDNDGDLLHYTWKLDGSVVGKDSASCSLTFPSLGKRSLICYVTDGCATDSVRWSFTVAISTGVDPVLDKTQFEIIEVYPNPISLDQIRGEGLRITIRSASQEPHVSFGMFDIKGRKVASMVLSNVQTGLNTVHIDLSHANESSVSLRSGTYFIRLSEGKETRVQPITIMR